MNIKNKQLNWYGHVRRNNEESYLEKLWNGVHLEEGEERKILLFVIAGSNKWDEKKGINSMEWIEGEDKIKTLDTERCGNIGISFINKIIIIIIIITLQRFIRSSNAVNFKKVIEHN